MTLPEGTYTVFESRNAELLRRMQETPSQLPNLSIYGAWQQDPVHFDENLGQYAKQLGVGTLDLMLKTTDFGPLERAIKSS